METKEIEKKLMEFSDILSDAKSKLNIDNKTSRLDELDKLSSDSSFWSRDDTKEILEESKSLRTVIDKYNNLFDNVNTLKEMIELELSEDYINSISNELDGI